MANALSFILKLQDMLTPGMRQAARISDTSAGKIQSEFDKISRGGRKMGASVNELRERLDAVNRVRFGTQLEKEFETATRAANKLEKKIEKLQSGVSGSRIAGWRKDFSQSLPGAGLISNPLVLSGAAIGGFWAATQKAMEAGKEKMKLQVLTGSQEIGETLYNGLTKFATDTVFGSEVYNYATQMLANGIKDADVMPLMKQLGDISMGDADKLGQLSLAFAQINGKGHLAGQELLQLINAGFNPLQVISEKTGQSMASLTKKMSEGKITVADVKNAMQMATGPGGKFANMLETVANTPYGQLEGLKGQLEQMFIKIGEVFLPIASGLMQFVSWVGEKMGPYLQPAVVILGGLATGLLVVAAAQWAWNAAQLANPVTWIILGIIALIATIVYVVAAFSGWGKAWDNLMTGLKYTWYGFTGAFKVMWLNTVDAFMVGIELIQKGWYKVKSLWDEEGANAGLSALKKDAEDRSRQIAYQKGLNTVYDNTAKEAFSNIIGKNGLHQSNTLSGTVKNLKNAVGLPGSSPGVGMHGKGEGLSGDRSKSINEGGQRSIVINIGKQIEKLEVSVLSAKEGANEIEAMVREAMRRVVYSMNGAVG